MTKIIYIISDINKALAFEWIVDHIDKSRFDLSFILIVQQESELEAYLISKGIECHTFYYRRKCDLVGVIWKVYRLLMFKKPALVHCHLLHGTLLGLTAAKLAGIKQRIYTRHHSDYHQRYFPKGIKWDKWCNRMATSIIAPSAAVKEVLMKYEKVSSSKIITVHHGFDLNYFMHVQDERVVILEKKYNVSDNYPVIGVISRFTELKGIQFVIPAFKRLLNEYPGALLLLFNAKGDYEYAIKEQLNSLPERSYRLISFENDLSAVYRLFDVFVQVSTDRTIEAFGQTYVEALASGVPSVFTLSGIAPDFIVDGENALVVPFKDAEAIYQAIIKIIGDETLQRKLVRKGCTTVKEKFDLKIMIQKLEELYATK